MSEKKKLDCLDCREPGELDRRQFIQVVGKGTTLVLAAAGVPTMASALEPRRALTTHRATRRAKPAEGLVEELYRGMNDWQRENVLYPFDHGGDGGRTPTRLRVYNRPLGRAIGETYTAAQRGLIEKILLSMSSGEEGYQKINRNGDWDSRDGILGCGADIFGDPTGDGNYSFVFTGHHMTIRCDGNSEPDSAFGGPLFYGHLPNGYSERNVFNYQTRSVMNVFDALTVEQRRAAVVTGNPGQGLRSVRFRGVDQRRPGIGGADLSADQKLLVKSVMRDLLSPYREEDVDEVMQIVEKNGGMERIHLAFYAGRQTSAREPWSYWRLEGPGFVWNFRVLPHVHTYVNVARQPQAV